MVGRRLTDKKRKNIIADWMETGSYRQTGKRMGISATTVRNIVLADGESVQLCAQKKKENTLDMLAYMESRKNQAQGVIDRYLVALADPEKLEDATLAQIATALGIVVDKFTKTTEAGSDALARLDKLLEGIGDAAKR